MLAYFMAGIPKPRRVCIFARMIPAQHNTLARAYINAGIYHLCVTRPQTERQERSTRSRTNKTQPTNKQTNKQNSARFRPEHQESRETTYTKSFFIVLIKMCVYAHICLDVLWMCGGGMSTTYANACGSVCAL